MRRILVADDDITSRLLLEDTLTSWGFDVICCADGREASEILASPDPPRLAILDWMMPGLDGVELCRRQRARADAAYTYAIVLTSRSEKKDLVTALDAGADDYLIKPVDPAELKSRVSVGLRVIAYETKLSDKNRLLQEANDELARLARTDALTGLANRRHFMDRLGEVTATAAREGAPACALMLDLDHFKRVNDTYGHATGDRVLAGFADVLRSSVRAGDVLGRLGGEEFACLLPRTALDEARAVAERIRARYEITPHTRDDGGVFRGTCCVGAAEIRDHEAADALLARADAALYRAKTGGRNRVIAAEDPAGLDAADLLRLRVA